MTSPTPTTPAGWYAASDRPGEQRYWDGTAWTDAYQPAAPPTIAKKKHSTSFWVWQTVGAIVLLPVVIAVIGGVIGVASHH